MMDNHSWSRPAHNLLDLLFHFRSIAMDGAFLAGGFVGAVTASVKAAVGIVQQLSATWAKCSVLFALLAIQAYHLLHHCFFFCYASVCLNRFSIHFVKLLMIVPGLRLYSPDLVGSCGQCVWGSIRLWITRVVHVPLTGTDGVIF